jgi:serine/threonine protein kinase/formylglycine-generating enzyme required for sulfatase activity
MMTPERYQQIGRLYQTALAREPAQRDAFLAEACGKDDALRREVASLLAAHDEAGDFIEHPPDDIAAGWQLTNVQMDDRLLPRKVAHYRLLSLLGKGGMGKVYLAEDTRLKRKVALKLLPAEFTADADRVRRFAQEARAASALNHPNIVTIHEIGELSTNGVAEHYIVTEYVDGQTLRQRLANAPQRRLTIAEALDAAVQVAAALTAAHEAGIIHRDIKPENVMARRDGLVKVLDFGLAKLTETADSGGEQASSESSTAAGLILGTPRYMSPEQARGEKVDARTDLFSLGVVFYEMASGRLPFTGATTSDALVALLRDEPTPIADAPEELWAILDRALCKNREERYRAAEEMRGDLIRLKQKLAPDADAFLPNREPVNSDSAFNAGSVKKAHRPHIGLLIGVGALVTLLAAAGWWIQKNARLKWARAEVARIEEFSKAERFFEAYDLAMEVQKVLPNEPTLTRLMSAIADDLSVVSDPPGAQARIKRFPPGSSREEGEWQSIGATPIRHLQIARGGYLLSIEMQGYATIERTITGITTPVSGLRMVSRPIEVQIKLSLNSATPPGMVFVNGGEYRLASWGRPTDRSVQLSDYFIDKYEVSNSDYKQFINAGGYRTREYWRYAIKRGGREIPWEKAMAEFKDRTGLPGPRAWSNQEYPEGKTDHPVANISWYEAAAYAAYRGKEMPTIFQWERAARQGIGRIGGANTWTMPWGYFTGELERRANFGDRGTAPVNSFPFGMSPYGAYHMAGNVAEWCRNETSEGFIVSGGAWQGPAYQFGYYGGYPGVFTSEKIGFRCALNVTGSAAEQGAFPLIVKKEIPKYRPVSDAVFASWRDRYRYEQPPLDSQIVETVETVDWRRESVAYAGLTGTRSLAYLYTPKNTPPPWQVIQFLPSDDVLFGFTKLSRRVEGSLGAFIKAGRALLSVARTGYPEKPFPPDYIYPRSDTAEYLEMVLKWTAEERRALDYIATRNDIDMSRIGFLSFSTGNGEKILQPTVESRYRSMVLIGAGLDPDTTRVPPEMNPVNLLPQIRAPKLLLSGRWDENTFLKFHAMPLYQLLRGQKRMMVFDGGHMPPPEYYVPLINAWFDETLGAVRTK